MMISETALSLLVFGALVLVIAAPVVLAILFLRDRAKGNLW